ncbi:hypothetical protein Glove_139g20 [Diversispora epigaea]|uniref:ATP-dependent RNA helicase SUV3 DEXQ-box helicase domain-containing protein n=1 Tax=Diversispora epigaea TaxID=1348612 RepID=A0A397J4M3_9GLOM|nr:hypothetical protein Glove_139g20 [Diversispora epigaea]
MWDHSYWRINKTFLYLSHLAECNDEVELHILQMIHVVEPIYILIHMGIQVLLWAWTQALFGLQAKEIHLCGEASVVPLVRTICEEVEVKEYERLSKLVINENSLNAIFSLKHEIEEGLRCAVAYGGDKIFPGWKS